MTLCLINGREMPLLHYHINVLGACLNTDSSLDATTCMVVMLVIIMEDLAALSYDAWNFLTVLVFHP